MYILRPFILNFPFVHCSPLFAPIIIWQAAYCYKLSVDYPDRILLSRPQFVLSQASVTMSTMVCTVCNDNITDKAMKAGDKLYHEEHFTCTECGTSLADPSVATYTKNESLYCQQDYMKKFVPICAKCDQYITQVISWIPQGDQ